MEHQIQRLTRRANCFLCVIGVILVLLFIGDFAISYARYRQYQHDRQQFEHRQEQYQRDLERFNEAQEQAADIMLRVLEGLSNVPRSDHPTDAEGAPVLREGDGGG